MNRIAFLLAPLALAGCASTATSPDVSQSLTRAPSQQALDAGMVSAADPRAADAGVQMLRQNGTATDAAVAVMIALTVVEPQSSGIGGGGLYVAANALGQVETIDGRETAPAAAHPQWFFKDGKLMTFAEAVPGATSVGVPGNIALAAKAHGLHGRLPWARLFAPAIKLARDGFAITPRLHAMLKGSRTAPFTAEARALYYQADGSPKPVGTVIKNPALAATLQAIASKGAKAFYSGANAQAIVGKVTTAAINPAPMTLADVAGYKAKRRDPICGTYRQFKVCGMGPPSSGGTTVVATLIQLERFDLAALGMDSPVAWHLIAESERLAYADRARYSADADFVPVPATGMVDRAYLTLRSALIDPAKAMPAVTAGTPPGAEKLSFADSRQAQENGTSHISVVDRSGHSVAYTSTIESAFGSGLMAGGYYLNNELTDFDMNPELDGRQVANRVEGGKRPRSSMSPTLVFGPDGKLFAVVGAAGGATIPAQVIRAIIGMIDWKLAPQQALTLPVVVPFGDTLFVEQGSMLEAMIPELNQMGHAKVTPRNLPLKAQAIRIEGTRAIGGADPRSEGRAVSE